MSELWEDEITKGAARVHNYLNFLIAERGQLYGTIIHLMLNEEFTTYELPPTPETFREYGERYYIAFEQSDEGRFRIALKDRQHE